MHQLIGKYLPEILALLLTGVTILVGLYFAWFIEPVWLNRAGALIIITGVTLAASRFHEKAHSRALSAIEANYDLLIKEVSEKLANLNSETVSETRSDYLRQTMLPAIRQAFVKSLETNARRIRMWEIWLVIIGTFLNGFGDYIITLTKRI